MQQRMNDGVVDLDSYFNDLSLQTIKEEDDFVIIESKRTRRKRIAKEREIGSAPTYGSESWNFLASDTMKEVVDRSYYDLPSLEEMALRKDRRAIAAHRARKKKDKAKSKNYRKHRGYAFARPRKSEVKYEGHSSSAPTALKVIDWSFYFFLFFMSALFYMAYAEESTGLAVYEHIFDDPTTTIATYEGWIVLILTDLQCILIGGTVVYLGIRLCVQFLLWLGGAIMLRRRVRRLRTTSVFNTQSSAQANLELILKIAYGCDWSCPTKAASTIAAIAQVFRPNLTIQNQIKKIFQKLSDNPSYVGQSVSIEKNLRLFSYQGQADEETKFVEKAEKYWNGLCDSDLGIGLSQIAVILVTTGVLPEIDWNVNQVELFSLKAAKDSIKAKDVYCACRKVIVSVVDGVSNYETTGKLSGFFANSSLESQVSHYLSLYQQVQVGNLYDYTSGITNDAYLAKLESLRCKVEAVMLDPRSKDKYFFRPYLDKLNDTISAMASLNLKQKYQEQAFGVMFHGESSVGKSWIALPMIKWILGINKYDNEDENVITYNTNSAFDDQIRNDTFGILLDDLANGKVGKGSSNQRRTSDLIISLINNVAQAAIKADVSEKGKVLMKMKVVLATTNNRGLNAEIESHKPGSVRRRFKYEVEFVVKEKYCLEGSHALDATKVQKDFRGHQFPPVWDFKITECKLVSAEANQAGFVMEQVKNKAGGDTFGIYEFLEFIRDNSKDHFEIQRENLSNNTKEVAIDEITQLPKEVAAYKGQSFTEDAYNTIFGLDDFEDASPAEVTYLRDTANLIYQDGRVLNMLRSTISWRNWLIINALPSVFLRIWIRVGGSPVKFITVCCAITAWAPYLVCMLPLEFARIYATILFMVILWVITNMSVNCVFETIAANAASNSMRKVWRSVFQRSSRTFLLKRLAVAGAGFMFITWLLSVSEISYAGQSLEADSVEEELEKIKQPSAWRKFMGIAGTTAGGKTCTMRTEELANVCADSVVRVKVGNEETCAFFIATGYLVVPKHFVNAIKEQKVTFEIFRPNGRVDRPVVDLTSYGTKRQWVTLPNDGVLFRLTGVNRSTDIIEYFAKRKSEKGYNSSRFLYRDEEGTLNRYNVHEAIPKEFEYECPDATYQGHGFLGHLSTPTVAGMCCSLVIADEKKPEIYGYHIAGNEAQAKARGHTLIQSLTQEDIMSAIGELDKVCEFKYIKQDIAYGGQKATVTSSKIHPLCATKYLDKNVPVEVLGSVPGSGPRHMKITQTPYADKVEEYFETKNEYGRPKSTATYEDGELKSPWINCIKEFCLTRSYIPYTTLAYAQDMIFDRIITKLPLYIAAGGRCSPLTPEEAYRGTPDRGFEGHTWNTSSGVMWGGKKWAWLLDFDLPRTYKPEVMKTVEETIELCRKRIRVLNTLNANLKDEPLKLKKVMDYRTRVFFSDELHMMIVFTMFFGPPLAYLLIHPETACCAIGLNAMSFDWECVWHFLLRTGEKIVAIPKNGVALDFKAFDKSLCEALMKFAWGILIRVAEQMPGYNMEDINVMYVLVEEKTTPYIRFNGTLIQCAFMHTSGNGGTAAVGSLAGLMLLVCAFVDINDPDRTKMMNFFDFVRSIHLGDDCNSTVIRVDEHNFNFLTLQAKLKEWGITITPPDKSDNAEKFQSIEEEDFLKRHFREDSLRHSRVGILAKGSMYKSLLWYLPSQTESKENQLGMSLSSTLLEASLYDEDTYIKFQNFVKSIAEEYNLHVPNMELNYEQRLIKWASESGKRHHEYRLLEKPNFREMAEQNKLSNAEQINIFGHVLNDQHDEPITYIGQSATKKATLAELDHLTVEVECCVASTCCLPKRRRGEVDVGNTLPSSVSGRKAKANIRGVVENNDKGSPPDKDPKAPSAPTTRATARFKYSNCVITMLTLILCGISEACARPEFDLHTKGKGLTERKENITFKFNDQSWTNAIATSKQESMSAASHSGMELGSFLSRPVKIGQIQWADNNTLSTTEINPWDAFLTNPAVARKIANYKLLRGNLHVKIVTNGSPFLYGKLMAYYNPLPQQDAFIPSNVEARLCRLSQRQHVYINPTTSSGGELVLPFFWQYNAVHIPNKEWSDLGDLRFMPVSALKHAAGEVPACNISVFAWMEDAELMQSTSAWTGYTGQSESSKKVVSKTATAVGDVASVLAKTPVIGPYARATEEVARSVGWFADLFGFSKPRGTHDICDERQRHLGTLCTTNDKDMARPLTFDIKNETTIDPRTVGLSGEDEMSIPHICQKECLMTRFSWNVTDGPDTELFRIPITPFIKSTFPTDGLTDLPPCAYTASFFEYWRGTMNYRFIFNASNFHRGKLRFRYEPYASTGDLDYNVVQSEIVDLSETHDYGIEIGWGADRNYLEVMGTSKSIAVPNTSADLLKHNGVLIVSVANNLTVPDETSESAIDILVGLSTGDDIQFSVPTDKLVVDTNLYVDQSNITTPAPDPEGTFTQPVDIGKYTFGVYYYGWHTNDFNNNQGYLRQDLTEDDGTPAPHEPRLLGSPNVDGEYVDTDTTVIRKQLDAMLKCGITHVCCSYWGSTSRTHTQLLQLRTLLGVGASGLGHMRFSLHYEAAKWRNSDGSWKDIDSGANKTEFDNDIAAMKDQLENTDKAIWRKSHVSGEALGPQIVIYLFRSMPYAYSKRFLQRIHDIFQDSGIEGYSARPHIVVDAIFGSSIPTYDSTIRGLIGGITAYDVYGQTARNGNETSEADVIDYHTRFQTAGTNNPRHKIVPTISPGYNDRGVRLSANHEALSRSLKDYEPGSLFKCHLKHLATSGSKYFSGEPRDVLINSWNEWHEDSQIEPCTGSGTRSKPENLTNGVSYEPYGAKYLNILGDYNVTSYVGQSKTTGDDEAENEHAPEMDISLTMVEKQNTYHHDDAVFFGERISSFRSMIKRYTRLMKRNNPSAGTEVQNMPQYPYFLENTPAISGTLVDETMLNRVAALFLGRRGSVRYKVLNDFHNSTARVSTVTLTDNPELTLVDNQSSDVMFATGWNGIDAVTGVYNPVLEWEVPYYSNARFHISRSLSRMQDRGHAHLYDTNAIYRNHYLVAAGDDLQFFYFMGTPSVTFA